LALLNKTGQEIDFRHPLVNLNTENRKVLNLTDHRHTLEITGLTERPVLSLNREFSAPIELDWNRSRDDLFFLYNFDNDAFNRWADGHKLLVAELHRFVDLQQRVAKPNVDEKLAQAFEAVLRDERLDPALRARMVEPPSMSYLAQSASIFDPANSEAAM